MESLMVFLIWLAIAIVGVIISVRKKAAQQEAARQQDDKKQWDEDIERHLREVHEQMINRQPAEKVAEEGTLESEAAEPAPKVNTHEAAVKPAPAPEPAPKAPKGKEMDFDPEQMIVYSEIMKPGYEKY